MSDTIRQTPFDNYGTIGPLDIRTADNAGPFIPNDNDELTALRQRAERAETENGRLMSDMVGYVAIGQGLQELLEQAEATLTQERQISEERATKIDGLEDWIRDLAAERDALEGQIEELRTLLHFISDTGPSRQGWFYAQMQSRIKAALAKPEKGEGDA